MRTKQTKIYFNQGSVLSTLIITQTKKTDIGSCPGEVMGNSCNLRISVSLNNQSQYGDLSIPTPGSTRLNKLLLLFKKNPSFFRYERFEHYSEKKTKSWRMSQWRAFTMCKVWQLVIVDTTAAPVLYIVGQ